jgi:biotin/methionine sulfoxide reductase
MVYWAGGNPFHHHQDLNRLVRAFKRPRTIVVNDIWWTATARHADIVLPIASPLERNDICMSRHDHQFVAMQCAIEPRGEARTDFDVFSELSARLGFAENFSEGKTESDWLREFWKGARERAVEYGFELPDFDSFWKQGVFEIPLPPEDRVLLADFRADPEANPLPTPSGKIEIFSAAIDAFGYADCPGHPVWLEPCEWLGGEMASHYPLHLISGQPPDRLHGQNDGFGPSRKRKIAGREALSLNPADARRRGIRQGDVVRVYNDRGACLAGANLSDAIMPGVVQLFAGAWYDPERPGEPGSLDKHGNPNVLTCDRGTSSLSQATTAHTTLVEVERFVDPAPPVTAFEPPELSSREDPG